MTEMRNQAENVTRVHSIYVVDDKNKLKGRLSLKDLLTAPSESNIRDVYIPQVDFVNVHTEGEEVARIMQKYDLEAIPVVDEMGRLVGRITIDDIVDFIKEEADKDYQMASGISESVEADDGLLRLTRARLPWLVLGLFGGLGSVYIMQGFEDALEKFPILFFFTPLIAAMAGNVGVQSSAIIVQGLANGNLRGSLVQRLIKEVSLSLINGIALGILVMLFGFVVGQDQLVSITIAISLLAVIIVAALVGTFIPIILNKQGIDPAIATGPFITTSNDIFGIFLFFQISKIVLGF
jgi:magnesium transporter